MNCPEHLVLKALGGRVWVWMYWADVPREYIPLRIWLNPLRYQFSVRIFGRRLVINREGRWNLKVSNAAFHVRQFFAGFRKATDDI